jgi:hypothetical protein
VLCKSKERPIKICILHTGKKKKNGDYSLEAFGYNLVTRTPLFHKQSQFRRNKNTIQKIQLETRHTTNNFDQIKEAATQHYERLYTQESEEGTEMSKQAMLEIRSRKQSLVERNQ